MPSPHRSRSRARRPLRLLGTAAAAVALLFTASPTALAADPTSDYACDPGLYRINTAGADRPLTVALSDGNHGSVIQYFWGDESNQKWWVCRKHSSDGRELVYFKDSWRNWCMVVDRWGTDNGNWVITVGCGDDVPANQAFWMARLPGTDRFALQAQHSGKWVASQNHSDGLGYQIVQESKPDLFYLQAV